MDRVAIAIIVWNNADDALECADSLLNQAVIESMKIVFVDNASNSATVTSLKQYIKSHTNEKLTLIQTGSNRGTAGGFNAGIQWAIENDFDYIGTLNADAIADRYWVESLIDQLTSHLNCGMATGILARRDGKTIDTTGDFYTTWGIPGPRLRGAAINKAPEEAGEVFGTTGGGFIARTELFKQIGLFDEKFFMYYEDVDISFRAQLSGWKVRYTPKAIAYHKLGASSSTVPGLTVYNTFKNLPILFIKNVPTRLMPAILLRFTIAYFLILSNAIIHGRGKYAIKGWIYKFTLIPHALRERQRIQAAKTVSDTYINSIILHDIPPEQTGLRAFRNFFIRKKHQ